MKKSISITPVDDEMEVSFNALILLNRFRGLGYNTRRSFLQVVSDFNPAYASIDGFNQLTAFWNGRIRNEQLNTDVEKVINKLKAE